MTKFKEVELFVRWRLWLAVVAIALLGGSAGPLQARDYDHTVVVNAGESVVLQPGETIHGDLVITGGNVQVLGHVEGKVLVTAGKVALGATAKIDGDLITAGGSVEKDYGAVVSGKEQQLSAADLAQRLSGAASAAKPVTPASPVPSSRPATPAASATPATPAVPAGTTEVKGDVTSYGSPAIVPAGEVRKGDVSSCGGPVTIQGELQGDVSSYGGAVTISGVVTGDIASYGGLVSLGANSHVHGDVAAYGGGVTREPGAIVDGNVTSNSRQAGGHGSHSQPKSKAPSALTWLWWALAWLMITLLVVLFAERTTETVADVITQNPRSAVAHGLLTLLLFTPACVILACTGIGVLVIPALSLLLVAAAVLGGVAVSLALGRKLAGGLRWPVTSVLGLALIGASLLLLTHLLDMAAYMGAIAWVVSFAVIVVGLGGVVMIARTRFRRQPVSP